MLQRLLYPWHLPPYGLPNVDSFSWKPEKLTDEMLHLPEHVRGIVEGIKYEWMFDFSCAVARQLRQVGARLDDHSSSSGAVLIANDQQTVSPVTSAHAFLMSMAQPAAIEMAGLMMESASPVPPSGCHEITGVAFFAESASVCGAGRRLRETMQLLANQTTQRCVAGSFVSPSIWFTHSKPAQARSPIEGYGVMPVAGYRIRFSGCTPASILQALADAVQTLPPAHRVDDKSDVMVLSNLWSPASV